MARALINVPKTARRGEIIEIKALIAAPDGDRLSRRPERQRHAARHHPAASSAPMTARWSSPPSCSRPSPPIRSSPSRRWRPTAARSPSPGPTTTARRRPRRADDHGALMSRRRWRCALVAAVVLRRRSPARSRRGERRSGFDVHGAARRRRCRADDSSNPGMLWVLDGEALWNAPAGTAGRPVPAAMATPRRACAASPPAIPPSTRRAAARSISRAASISAAGPAGAPRRSPARATSCWRLTAYVAHQSRGMPITPAERCAAAAVPRDGRAAVRAAGWASSTSPAPQCHDEHWGERLGGSVIPQAHPTGYPLYRLEWQTLGSLQRRLRSCMVGVRAEPFAFGAPELVDLEFFLMSRAAGLTMETPAVRP